MVQEINSAEEFDKAIASGVVLVDFFATWCGPCKMIAPVLDKFSKEYEQVTFYKVDVDKLSEVAARFEISAMPTFLFFQNGEVVSKVTGANAAAIKQTITKLI
ncbi:Cytoplasmic thioredoxin isoenzyme 1 [Komagataella phaffii CBS 7435]|uniref:Thioredoxin n=3 Tax=Komagataella TaxID=460517 RepID=C4R7E5_KOMPG|nr:Cytoplasmic thioredoxin isoenzyme of the thioredoxin system [Komagataella phaffii GS115]AOA64704.1 GQ67_04616T0 [Komagataella phaffii]KAI0461337.1 thioredoxin trx1 [Komagataella kurtzmanii]CAH2451106.1 Cytoplasmic thioredoxin isoenzyme 1 [Komagataella phaffii CBS 7435]BAH80208.1 thioredoxin-2 [Komagataella pastoris]AOA70364.1 GQ68_04588T0 [Komagataella phaffii GS115]